MIGLDVRICDSSDAGLRGLVGKVVDETRNTFRIEDGRGFDKVVAKDICVFEFTSPDGHSQAVVDGKLIRFRPEDRIKKAK